MLRGTALYPHLLHQISYVCISVCMNVPSCRQSSQAKVLGNCNSCSYQHFYVPHAKPSNVPVCHYFAIAPVAGDLYVPTVTTI